MPTGSSRSAFGSRDLRLPEFLREELKRPLGPVLSGEALLVAVRRHAVVVSVGDFCTAQLLRAGIDVRVAVVDGRTLREASLALPPELAGLQGMAVRNPPATITAEAWDALGKAFKSGVRVRLDVIGEEDLLTLPALLLAPPGACVVYGQPGEGAVVVAVDAAARRRARGILTRMV